MSSIQVKVPLLPDEAATIRRFFEHFCEARPTVCAAYNGNLFDFPFLLAYAYVHGIDMYKEIGFAKDAEDKFKSRACVHMDRFRWVKRDLYLPQGSQGHKAVTVAKLGYYPIELNPELMMLYAAEQPQILTQYSVSDAVVTYYLYMSISLCNIIPLSPDKVLRKGLGQGIPRQSHLPKSTLSTRSSSSTRSLLSKISPSTQPPIDKESASTPSSASLFLSRPDPTEAELGELLRAVVSGRKL